jgi:RNA polymerase sigma-70 factor (ECF subfamily)
MRKKEDVFQSLIAPHLGMLYKAAWRLTGRADDAEDLVQELLVRLYPRTREMQKVELLAPWLKKALYRQFIDLQRKRTRRPEHYVHDFEVQVDEMQADNPDPEELAQRSADRQRLRAALQMLGPENRSLVVMHLVEGYTLAELEEFFNVSAETLKTRLRRSKARLKKFLLI